MPGALVLCKWMWKDSSETHSLCVSRNDIKHRSDYIEASLLYKKVLFLLYLGNCIKQITFGLKSQTNQLYTKCIHNSITVLNLWERGSAFRVRVDGAGF